MMPIYQCERCKRTAGMLPGSLDREFFDHCAECSANKCPECAQTHGCCGEVPMKSGSRFDRLYSALQEMNDDEKADTLWHAAEIIKENFNGGTIIDSLKEMAEKMWEEAEPSDV
jgi:hypothetical protein